MQVRRVVTGVTEHGKCVIAGDEKVAPITVTMLPGAEFHHIWGSDATPEVPLSAQPPAPTSWFPPAGGFRFVLVTLPPDSVTMPEHLDVGAALVEFNDKLPGLADTMEPDSPGMHTSNTIDVVLIVSGEVILELSDGVQVALSTGDCVVQNGTRHAWRNPTPQPCTMASAIVGARRTA